MSSVKAMTSCSMQSEAISSSSARGEDLAGRVVRGVEDEAARPGAERAAKLVRIDRPVRLVERHVAGHGLGEDRVRAVILVVRLEDHDFVARIEHAEHRRDHRLGRAARDRDLCLRVDLAEAREVARRRLGDGIAERLRAPGDRVLVDVSVDGIRDRPLELRRAREVGEALRQADRALGHRHPVHLADDRFGEGSGLPADAHRHVCHARFHVGESSAR